MAINKKLIHFQTMANFEAQLSAGNILDTSIVFIKDAKKIWTHGEFYDCNDGSGIKKFIFTAGFTFDEDSWEEYQKADEFYYYHEDLKTYTELYKVPSPVGMMILSGGDVNYTKLITVSVNMGEDGSNCVITVDEIDIETLVDDYLTDAGVGSPLEYVILEPIYDGMVLEDLWLDPYETKQLQLISQFGDEVHQYNLYKAHISVNMENISFSLYGYYDNNTIICVSGKTSLATYTLTCVLNLIPIGGGEGGYDDTEIKGQIREIEATIGDINTVLESIINGGIITFTIDNIEYQAEQDMTWEAWVNSQYNTAEYYVIYDKYIRQEPYKTVIYEDTRKFVLKTDFISNISYITTYEGTDEDFG